MTTIKDICKATGFSTATVSRVLNDSPLVTEETKRKVRAAMQRLGYRPHHAARSLKLNRTGMIAVVFPDIDHGFFTEVLLGADRRASEGGVHLLTAFSHGNRDHRELVTRMVRERRADALILMNLTLPDSFFRQFSNAGVPIVLIDRPCKIAGIGSISIDNAGGVRAMMRHLAEGGYRRVAFVAGPKGTYDADQRLLAFRRAAEELKLDVEPELVWQGDFTEAGGARAIQAYLETRRRLPEAIFASNDAMAVGILQVLRERGVRVPDDIALAGFDDIPATRLMQLTTVRVPMRELGRRAVELALSLLESGNGNGARRARHELLSTELIARESTRPKSPRSGL